MSVGNRLTGWTPRLVLWVPPHRRDHGPARRPELAPTLEPERLVPRQVHGVRRLEEAWKSGRVHLREVLLDQHRAETATGVDGVGRPPRQVEVGLVLRVVLVELIEERAHLFDALSEPLLHQGPEPLLLLRRQLRLSGRVPDGDGLAPI